jgi:hypothetical protein
MRPSPIFLGFIFDINTIWFHHLVHLQPVQVMANIPRALVLPAICKGPGIVSDPTILQPSNWRQPSVLATIGISMVVITVCPYVVVALQLLSTWVRLTMAAPV